MCAPSVPEPVQYQTSQSPVYRDGGQRNSTTGRRGTILSGRSQPAGGQSSAMSSNAPVQDSSPVMKKTVLGG